MRSQSSRLIRIVALAALLLPFSTAQADETPSTLNWRIGISSSGTPKYQPGFTHFDYVNPQAPKGGKLRLSQFDTFDTLNPLLAKGSAGVGLNLVFETLLKSSLDEVSTSYGLLAEAMDWPEDISWVSFRLRQEAQICRRNTGNGGRRGIFL